MLLKTFDVFWLKFCLFLLLQWSHSALNLHILGYQWVFKKSSFVYVLFCKGYVDDYSVQFHSVAQSCWTLRPHGLQHARFPCPSPTPRVYSNSCPVSQWYHPIISSSVIPFSFWLQSLPASVFSNESAVCIRWPKDWSSNFSISPSNEYSGLISFRMDWFDFLAVQGALKSLLQHRSSKVSIL